MEAIDGVTFLNGGDSIGEEGVFQVMAPAKSQKRVHCKKDDYFMLLDYLEDAVNYDHLFGAGRKTHIGGKFMSKTSSWEMAATELKALGFQETKGSNLYKKWQRYIGNFREAKLLSQQTGEGLSEDDISKGITFEDKLNAKCAHFYKFDALMGSRANIEPLAKSGAMGFEDMCTPSIGDSQVRVDVPIADLGEVDVGERSSSPFWFHEADTNCVEHNEEQDQVQMHDQAAATD